MIDSHSHIGGMGSQGADASYPIQPDVRIIDSINVRDTGFQKAQAGGITVGNIMPGSGHLLSGQTAYLKYRDGKTVDDLIIRNPDGSPAGGMKMANGTNSIKAPPFPGTRAKSAELVREQFIKAQEYRDKVARANSDPEKLPPRPDKGVQITLWTTALDASNAYVTRLRQDTGKPMKATLLRVPR